MVHVRELNDQAALQQLIADQPLQPFLQSWAWGDFQAALGRPIWRLGAFEGDKLVGSALCIGHELMLNRSYLYCPRGPLFENPEALEALVSGLKKLGQEQSAMYIKIDPNFSDVPWDSVLTKLGQPGTTLQPRHTRLIDTSQPLDALLAACHSKTRYNIRLAEKRGVTVRWSTESQDVAILLTMLHQTYDRQGIRLHPDSYYQKQFQALVSSKMAEIVIAEHRGEPLVANMVVWHGQTATYLHGGSGDDHKEMMAPHLVQWRTIERAHQRGVKTYDLWGVAPADQPHHRWQGVSRFKRGFPGREIDFPLAVNIILQPQWYQAYHWAKRFRGGMDE